MKNISIDTFKGEHCETTATGALLSHIGLSLSEPMLFGLGESLSYGTFKFGDMPFPFIGGRVRTFEVTQNLCCNLDLELVEKRTTSKKYAWNNVKEILDNGDPVGLQLDCYYLDYFTSKVHFAGHFVAMTGYDDEYVYLIDTDQQGGKVKTTLDNLALARSSKQTMYGKNLSYTITKSDSMKSITEALPIAIKNNATAFLNPPIRNLGYKGIIKTADELKKYYNQSDDVERDFTQTAIFMERAGTGGALFRNMYRDFLKESMDILENNGMEEAYLRYKEAATLWTKVSGLFEKVGITEDIKYVDDISGVLREIADIEYRAMKTLEQLFI